MRKLWFGAAVAAALCISTAFAADSSCPHQAPPCEPCGCSAGKECAGIPIPDEKCRILDPACCPGSDYCLVDTCRAEYCGPCPGACYEILSCIDWSCNKCGKSKDKCGCKTCGCKQQKSCGCKQEKSCGCKAEKSCGCKQEKTCGCKAEKTCGCKNKCQSKCGNCSGDVECHCYVPYVSPGPRHENLIYMPKLTGSDFVPSMNEGPAPQQPNNNDKVVKVIGRG